MKVLVAAVTLFLAVSIRAQDPDTRAGRLQQEIRNSVGRERKGETADVSLFMHRSSVSRIVGIERTWHVQ